MNRITTIWKKELRDTIRDRRTLLSSIILPMVLMPGIILGIGKFAKLQTERTLQKTVTIAVLNPEVAPEFVALLKGVNKVQIQNGITNPSDDVRKKKIDLAIVLPRNAADAMARNESIPIVSYENSLNDRSSLALSKVATVIAQYNQLLLEQRLQAGGVDVNVIRGMSIEPKETATAEELGGFGLGFLLPLFIIMWATIGGQYTAIDVSAGEKERKTLEALLMTPVRRIDIVFGKFFAVATTALVSVVVALGSLYSVFAFGGSSLFSSGSINTASGTAQGANLTFNFSLHPAAIAVLFGMSVLLVLLFSAFNLSLAIFAKSYKEAQSYIGPSYLVIILPVVAMNIVPGFVPTTGFFAIPIVNAVLLFKEVLVGSFIVSHILLTGLILAAAAFAAILVASRIYHREGVLFKE